MIDVEQLIKQIEEDKLSRNVEPHFALYRDLQTLVLRQLDQELNQMARDKQIRHGRTLNDKWITLTTKEQ